MLWSFEPFPPRDQCVPIAKMKRPRIFVDMTSPAQNTHGFRLLLDYPAAAEALSMSRGALRDLVYKGRGPVVTKIGSRTFFAVRDLEAFINRHREAPFS